MSLSYRLMTIAALVPNGARVCDIGTDHALLPIYLIKEKTAISVIATDIRPLPLKNANKNINAANVNGIETRLCDGLDGVLPNECDTIIIAGMGGEVISGIIDRAKWLQLNSSHLLILQPTTSPEILRKFLCENGFNIETEIAIKDNNKLYSILTVKFTGKKYEFDQSYFYVGKLSPNTEEGYLYIQKQYNRLFSTSEALKNIPNKHNEYLSNKKLAEQIENILNLENKNGI